MYFCWSSSIGLDTDEQVADSPKAQCTNVIFPHKSTQYRVTLVSFAKQKRGYDLVILKAGDRSLSLYRGQILQLVH
jgi:hypothetical protein